MKLKPGAPNIVEYVHRALSGLALIPIKKLGNNHWTHDDWVKWAEDEYKRHWALK